MSRYRPWLPGAKPLYRRWIDGEAHVTENEYSESGSEGDDAEMQMQQRDTEDFDMPPILAGHEERLRADTSYRVLSELLRPASLAPVAGPSSARDHTPLFLPGTPEPPERTSEEADRHNSADTPGPSPAKRRCIDASDGAAAGHLEHLSKFLDIHTFDDNEDEASDDKEEISPMTSQTRARKRPCSCPCQTRIWGKLAELAARYKEAGADYAVSALLEDADTPEVTQKVSLLAQDMVVGRVVTDEARDILPRPVPALPAQACLKPRPKSHGGCTDLPMPSEQKKCGEPKQRREYMEPGTWIILKKQARRAPRIHGDPKRAEASESDDGTLVLKFKVNLNKKRYPPFNSVIA
ncbi:hypothetical protein B0H17DRAFT_1139667 [Mycena rosella]|uniref:Uncharacterized protein n=1 Tax=Mycena rosella TaxID=1033263 RepID=A0AAD7D3W8_MYCRO|nr:hypothetical protein B0H17DRAFT_1139667 [Mycena rosella]